MHHVKKENFLLSELVSNFLPIFFPRFAFFLVSFLVVKGVALKYERIQWGQESKLCDKSLSIFILFIKESEIFQRETFVNSAKFSFLEHIWSIPVFLCVEKKLGGWPAVSALLKCKTLLCRRVEVLNNYFIGKKIFVSVLIDSMSSLHSLHYDYFFSLYDGSRYYSNNNIFTEII